MIFYVMLDLYKGVYMCTVQYQRKGKALNFTRSINVTAVCETTSLLHAHLLLHVPNK